MTHHDPGSIEKKELILAYGFRWIESMMVAERQQAADIPSGAEAEASHPEPQAQDREHPGSGVRLLKHHILFPVTYFL